MFEVYQELNFSAAHYLRQYKGRCERLHGHNWKIRVGVRAKTLNDQDMVLDFKILRDAILKIIAPLDHQELNRVPPFDLKNPTSEMIAYYIGEELAKEIDDHRIQVFRVDVWETEKACASYVRDNSNCNKAKAQINLRE
jgi:6-pyruvoyltetrahydropterin/6-carboxytetrahydropterin synthase